MDREPSRLSELRGKGDSPAWLISLVPTESGGGRLDLSQMELIEQQPRATALRVSGLDQRSFEYLIDRYGAQFAAIEFWKCPRVQDFSPLEGLTGLRLVSVYWNQQATRLWDLGRTPGLSGLHFDDFTRLHDLGDLALGGSLVELEFGDAVWDKSVFETLEPLSELRGLRALKLSAKKIEDGRVAPLGALGSLQSLSFSPKQFTTRQVAWLRARLPASLESEALEPLRTFSPSKVLQRNGKALDVLLVGKRKPFLSSVQDASRIQQHLEDFNQMVADFRANPSLLPE